MKILSRDFSTREKILMLILVLLLLGLGYYRFIDQPVREAIVQSEAERETLQTELLILQNRAAALSRMQIELNDMSESGSLSRMGSYNNSKDELALLNDILRDTQQYTISFSNVTRDGNQIRRNFALQFAVADYAGMQRAIQRLTESEYRCLIGDVSCVTAVSGSSAGTLTVNATATFYETMVGGVPDVGLPVDRAG